MYEGAAYDALELSVESDDTRVRVLVAVRCWNVMYPRPSPFVKQHKCIMVDLEYGFKKHYSTDDVFYAEDTRLHTRINELMTREYE